MSWDAAPFRDDDWRIQATRQAQALRARLQRLRAQRQADYYNDPLDTAPEGKVDAARRIAAYWINQARAR